jgi:hypothetical protein
VTMMFFPEKSMGLCLRMGWEAGERQARGAAGVEIIAKPGHRPIPACRSTSPDGGIFPPGCAP